MHIENLGEKTYLMTLDPDAVERQEDGSGQITFMNGSTETRLNITPKAMAHLPADVSMTTVTGVARLKVWVNDECSISGIEEMDVEEIKVSAVAIRETGFAETLPF